MNAIVRYEAPQVIHTILGQRPVRMPVGGKLHAGIKVLTKAAAANGKAKAIYDAGVAAQESFDKIERRIVEAIPELTDPLRMENTPYFVVRRGDFDQPALADMILDKYGTVREDGVKRLWSVPVVFPGDRWEMLLPHTYKCYSGSGLKYWAEFDPQGGLRCMSYEPVPIDPVTKRAMRLPNGRRRVPRPDNGGRCDPNACPQYQRKECALVGTLYFFIPGIPSIDLIDMSFRSINGLEGVRSRMMNVAIARGGRISGFLDDDQATFLLTKQLSKEVAGYDEVTGLPKKRRQHIITLSATGVDIAQILRAQSQRLLASAGAEAAAVLNGTQNPPTTVHSTEPNKDYTDDSHSAESAAEMRAQPVGVAAATATSSSHAQASSSPAQQAGHDGGGALDRIYTLLQEMSIERTLFDAYAKKRFKGDGWTRNGKAVEKMLGEVMAGTTDVDAYRHQLDSEANVFS